MSGVHKYPTISFRISPRERDEIEAKIVASGMRKKDYFIRSCIYNSVCVVGKKEVIYQLVEELQIMQVNITDIVSQFEQQEVTLSDEGLKQMRNDCLDMLKAIREEAGKPIAILLSISMYSQDKYSRGFPEYQ